MAQAGPFPGVGVADAEAGAVAGTGPGAGPGAVALELTAAVGGSAALLPDPARRPQDARETAASAAAAPASSRLPGVWMMVRIQSSYGGLRHTTLSLRTPDH